MLKTFSLKCSDKSYTIYRKEKTFTNSLLKPVDLIQWLHTFSSYPKVFWKSKTKYFSSAGVGSLIECSEIPSNIPQGLHLYGALPFWPKRPSKDFSIDFILPKYELIQKESTFTIAINSLDPINEELRFKKPFSLDPILPKIQLVHHLPHFENWQKNIKLALSKIGLKEFDKVVLARCSTCKLTSKIEPLFLLYSLFQKVKHSYLFFFQKSEYKSFLSASPEMLFSTNGNCITSEAIAGTSKIKRPKFSNSDLLKNTKEIFEFSFVKKYIFDAFKDLCKSVDAPSKINLLQANNLYHLHSQFSGILKEPINITYLTRILHPTPAIGGFPKNKALKFIDNHEPFNRGYYSAPVFHLSGNEVEAVVGIRSCYTSENILQLFAGAGIVQGSDSQSEWEELNNKMALIKDLFYGN